MRYEISDNQIRSLKGILANANIKGVEAPMIIELNNVLSRPIIEKPKIEKEGGGERKDEGKA